MGTSGTGALAFISLTALAACERAPQRTTAPPSSITAAANSVSSPTCPAFPARPEWGEGYREPVRIELHPPTERRSVLLGSRGVSMTFGYQAFVQAARCLKQPLAVQVLERRPVDETIVTITNHGERQLAVVAAALLDLGDVSVTDEHSRKVDAVLRGHSVWMGCGGACRQIGREYRLRIPGEVFFQITDGTAHGLRR